MNNRLKSRREKTGLTQVQVAEKTGITERSYQRYETGERVPNAHTALLIARTLNSTVEALFGAATPQIQKEPDGNQAK